MELDEVARSQIVLALDALRNNPELVIPIRDLKALLDPEQLAAYRQLKDEMSKSTKDMKARSDEPLVPLSGEGQAYWTKAEKAIAAGRLAGNLGSRGHERSSALLSEAVEEAWECVPREDHAAFLFYDERQGAAGWDDRWHHVEWKFPLLKRLEVNMPVPANYALVAVLSGFLDIGSDVPPAGDSEALARGQRLRALAARLRA